MMGLIIAIHVIICALLIVVILIQAGRGGGLIDNLAGMESMFGPKTNTFLTRTTTVLASLFFITCLSLAFLSAQQSRSLMSGQSTPAAVTTEAKEETAVLPQTQTQQEPPNATEAPR